MRRALALPIVAILVACSDPPTAKDASSEADSEARKAARARAVMNAAQEAADAREEARKAQEAEELEKKEQAEKMKRVQDRFAEERALEAAADTHPPSPSPAPAQKTERRPYQPPKVAMTQKVGGFSFGMTRSQVKTVCEGAGGVAIPNDGKGRSLSSIASATDIICTALPVKLDIEADGLSMAFCGSKVCEFILIPKGTLSTESADPVAEIRLINDAISKKYGEPTFYDDDAGSVTIDELSSIKGRCIAGEKANYRAHWLWVDTNRKVVSGKIIVGYGCRYNASGNGDYPVLIYQNEAAYRRRVEQLHEKQDNF